MCGIVGYVGRRSCIDIVYDGLAKLEYRGYDSAGIAVVRGRELGIVKAEGKLEKLKPRLQELPAAATRGIGHTRWATHGIPSTTNAHPHSSGKVALVHNGIIENYLELKAELTKKGAAFVSETDTEVILHLFVNELMIDQDALKAIRRMIPQLKGAFSIGILVGDEEDTLYGVKQGSPLVIGKGRGENFFASDAMALVAHTQRAHFLADGEIVKLTPDSIELFNFAGQSVTPHFHEIELSSASVEKLGFRHFMLKEIHEQPRVISSMIKRIVDIHHGTISLEALGLQNLDFQRITNITMVACGTAYYSALAGEYVLESYGGLPVSVELASEFRYRSPWVSRETLVIAVSQSGETADTLASVKYAKALGCQVMSVCNVKMSSIPRECEATLYMDAGPEIGVASTKAFTAMLLSHYLIALAIGLKKGHISSSLSAELVEKLRMLPALMDHAVDSKVHIEQIVDKYYESSHFIFIGRGLNYPLALEGALKLKEISYIHAEGYAGGELKHGPIALVDAHLPLVAIAPKDLYYEKMLSNIEEVKARRGQVIALGGHHDQRLRSIADSYLPIPEIDEPMFQSILSVIPLQLLAYYIAVKRGTDVDQPRNLAKSVTVE